MHTQEDFGEGLDPIRADAASAPGISAAPGGELRGQGAAGDQHAGDGETTTSTAAAAGVDAKLHALAGQGAVEELRMLLAAGLPVDARDQEGCTPLHFAADRGQLEVAQLLIAAGANMAAVDVDGQTALHYAALCGQEEVGWGTSERGHNIGSAFWIGCGNKALVIAELSKLSWLEGIDMGYCQS
jgi:hypothetical protein